MGCAGAAANCLQTIQGASGMQWNSSKAVSPILTYAVVQAAQKKAWWQGSGLLHTPVTLGPKATELNARTEEETLPGESK
jgi:hypothetical protein